MDQGAAEGPSPARAVGRPRRGGWAVRLWLCIRLNPWGAVGALIMFALGLSPSLLPRDFFYQSIVSGLAAGLGYLLGLGVREAWQRLIKPWVLSKADLRRRVRGLSARARMGIEAAFVGGGLLLLVGFVVASLHWQREIARITGAEIPTLWRFLLVIPIGGGIFVATVSAGRLLRRLVLGIAGWLPGSGRGLGRRLAAWGAVAFTCVVMIHWALPGTIVRVAEALFAHANIEPEEGVSQPYQAERSGSAVSEVEFSSLGTLGMRFVDGGLRAAELEDVTGRPAREPIRVYAGLGTDENPAGRTAAIISELERTRASEREAMLVVMPTGTGWVNAQAAQAFETLYDGDTAIVSAQYSYLPSAFHFLAGGADVQEAGRELINPIVDWWNALPEDNRPRLYLYGESLGSSAVESAFSGMRDIASSVDGILLTGPPNFNPLWQTLVSRRDPGTREVAPEYSAGLVVRFAQDSEDIARLSSDGVSWGPTRMLYIQHASDPVVWWSPDLILREPDWLAEPAGKDRFNGMVWLPGVTFLQVSADLPVSQNVPQGHGHNYGDSLVAGFAAVGGISDQAVVERAEKELDNCLHYSGERRFDGEQDAEDPAYTDHHDPD